MCLRYLEYMCLINSIDRSMMTLHSLRIAMKFNLCSLMQRIGVGERGQLGSQLAQGGSGLGFSVVAGDGTLWEMDGGRSPYLRQ